MQLYPRLIDHIGCKDHEVYQHESLQRLWEGLLPYKERNQDLLYLCRMMGHKDIKVFFSTYVHSLHFILMESNQSIAETLDKHFL